MFVRWMDNSVVTMASTGRGVSLSETVINRPNSIDAVHYCSNMAGTDLMDESVSNYTITIRSKK